MKTTLDYKEKTAYEPETWDNILKKNRIGFIFKYGVLCWGCTAASTAAILIMYIVFYGSGTFVFTGGLISASILIVGIFSVIGYFFGTILWKKFHKKNIFFN